MILEAAGIAPAAPPRPRRAAESGRDHFLLEVRWLPASRATQGMGTAAEDLSGAGVAIADRVGAPGPDGHPVVAVAVPAGCLRAHPPVPGSGTLIRDQPQNMITADGWTVLSG
jgi:hypothetical protein